MRWAQRPQWRMVIIGAACSVCIIPLLGLMVYQMVTDDKVRPMIIAPAATTLTILFAVVGFTANSFVQIRQSVKQHTINLLFQTRFSTTPFSEHRQRIIDKFVGQAAPKIAKAQIDAWERSDNEEDRKLAASLKFVANYYEFIAAGIKLGDLDEALLRDTIRSNLYYTVRMLSPMIRELRETSPTNLENLAALTLRWRDMDRRHGLD